MRWSFLEGVPLQEQGRGEQPPALQRQMHNGDSRSSSRNAADLRQKVRTVLSTQRTGTRGLALRAPVRERKLEVESTVKESGAMHADLQNDPKGVRGTLPEPMR